MPSIVGYTVVEDRPGTVMSPFPNSAYPNPFNSSVSIAYMLPFDGEVSIRIYDITGRKIRELFEGTQTAGHHSLVWSPNDLMSGIYFYKIQVGARAASGKVVLLK